MDCLQEKQDSLHWAGGTLISNTKLSSLSNGQVPSRRGTRSCGESGNAGDVILRVIGLQVDQSAFGAAGHIAVGAVGE